MGFIWIYMSHEKRAPGCLGYIGDNKYYPVILPLFAVSFKEGFFC